MSFRPKRTLARRTLAIALSLAAVLLVAAGCGEEENKSEVPEGEPLELGDVEYNVQITRFLNADDREDSEYLQGQKVPPPSGQTYLAVFIEVKNDGDDEATLPSADELKVVDTTDAGYPPLPNDNIFALDLGGTIGSDDQLPEDDTAASAGPTQGSIILFLVPAFIGANRPLELEIASGGEEGKIKLDI